MKRVQIPFELWEKMIWFAHRAGRHEIGGLGTLRVGEDVIRVASADVLRQTVSPGLHEPDGEAVEEWLIKNYGEDWNIKRPNIFFWHSHVDMGVTPSGIDTETITRLIEMDGAVVSVIVNQREEWSCRLDMRWREDEEYRHFAVKRELDVVYPTSLTDGVVKGYNEQFTSLVTPVEWRGEWTGRKRWWED